MIPLPPPTPDLVDRLTCPRCRREQLSQDLEAFRGFPQCFRRSCDGQRWFAMRLAAGVVVTQLIEAFDAFLATDLLHWYHLPFEISSAKLWQVSLTYNQYATYGECGSAHLFRGLITLYQASAVAVPPT